MGKNTIVAESNSRLEDEWLMQLYSIYDVDTGWPDIEKIASGHGGGRPCKVTQRIHGGFNYCFKLEFVEGPSWIMRFPIPGCTMLPLEKVKDEVAVMELIRARTEIPLPRVIACGEARIGSVNLGPYIMMEHVPGRTLDDLILVEGVLRPDVDPGLLQHIFRQMAKVLLELRRLTFDKIGAPMVDNKGASPEWVVVRGPLTMKSNEMKRLAGVDSKDMSRRAFTSTQEYTKALLQQSMRYLRENPMASESLDEAREHYNTLHALQFHFAEPSTTTTTTADESFCLFNDDIGFGNMIVDEDYNIVGLIDWEFCYAAPPSFLESPPPWLLGKDPFEWDDTDEYEAVLDSFLEALEAEERASGLEGTLSARMRRAWEDGTFWFGVAAREPLYLAKIAKHCRPFLAGLPEPEDSQEFGRSKMKRRAGFMAAHGLADT